MLIRFSYAVEGPVKFLSHLELLKCFCRAVKRAQIPIAYSEGYNPHPKIAFGPPRGVAVAGLCEYCDMKLRKELSPEDFVPRFNAALPKGICVNAARAIQGNPKPLQAIIKIADYEARITAPQLSSTELQAKIDALLAAEEAYVLRVNPKKHTKKQVNLAACLDRLSLEPDGRLKLSLLFNDEGSAKPGEVLRYLCGEQLDAEIVRTGLFAEDEHGGRRLP